MGPIKLITEGTPGLLPLTADVTGCNLVIHPDRLNKRMRFARNQILLNVSGFGCRADAMGRKIFGTHLDGEDAQWSVGDFIGIASDELLAAAKADTSTEAPMDLALRSYLAIAPGRWGRGDTILRACNNAGQKKPGKTCIVYCCHPEATVTDFGGISYPKGTTCEKVAGGEEKKKARG